MPYYIVTVVLSRVGEKNSFNCPLHGAFCSAPTGRHHSMLIEADDAVGAARKLKDKGHYVARTEATHAPL